MEKYSEGVDGPRAHHKPHIRVRFEIDRPAPPAPGIEAFTAMVIEQAFHDAFTESETPTEAWDVPVYSSGVHSVDE